MIIKGDFSYEGKLERATDKVHNFMTKRKYFDMCQPFFPNVTVDCRMLIPPPNLKDIEGVMNDKGV